MKEIIDKLSSYNIFNYLLPGTIFAVFLAKLINWNFIEKDLILAAFEYYFMGMLISRLGSLVIEPFLKWIKFVKFADYKDYIMASKKDSKLEVLSETNNEYRTLISMTVCILVFKVFDNLPIKNWIIYIFIIAMLIMFLFSYRKQTEYIRNRTKDNLK